MDLEARISSIKARIQRMYIHLGYDKHGIKHINSAQVEEKSSVPEVDRTKENTELLALSRALTGKH